MNHAQLKAFHAVARDGGFSAAARALGVTQPTLTVQVRALEDGYRVALFHRRGRRVTLTRAGEELYTIAQRYFSVEREAEEFLRAEGGLSQGRVSIAADGPFHVMPLIGSPTTCDLMICPPKIFWQISVPPTGIFGMPGCTTIVPFIRRLPQRKSSFAMFRACAKALAGVCTPSRARG